MPKHIFSPQRYLQTDAEHVQSPTGKGRREWLMARGLCHYQCFDLSNVATLKREEVLQLKIRQWSPFTQTGRYIAWIKGNAQVWIWDQAVQQQAQHAQAIKPLPVLPESILYPPAKEGLQLLKTCDGLEAQIWQNGLLRSSRWWSQAPDAATWQRFLRSNAQSFIALPEHLEKQAFLPKPWAKNTSVWRNLNLLWRQERLWVSLGLAALISVFIWEWLSVTRWQTSLTELEHHIEQLTYDAEPVLTARGKVLDIKKQLETLQQLDKYPGQLKILLAIASKLPKGAVLQEWHYDNGALKVQIKADSIDPREYVKLFQDDPLFDDVKPETAKRKGEIDISMRVLPVV